MRTRTSTLTEQALLLSVLIGGSQITWGALAPVLPLVAEEFATTVAVLGPALAAFGLGRAIVSIPAGILLRWWRPRPYLYVGVLGLVTSTSLTAIVDTPAQLVAFRVVAGVFGGAVITIAFAVLIAGAPVAKRGSVMATATVVQLSAAALGALLGGATADAWGLRAVFVVATVPVVLALLWDVARPARHYWAVSSARPVPPTAPDATAPGLAASASTVGTVTDLAPASAARGRTVVVVIASLAAVSFAGFFARFAGEQGLLPVLGYALAEVSPTALGAMLAGGTVVSLIALVPVSRAVDRGARTGVFVPASILTVTALMLIPLAREPWLFAVLIALYTSSSSIAGMIPSVVTADRVPTHLTGTAVGVTRTAGDLGAVVGPLAVFGVYGLAGVWWALGTIAVVIVVAAVAFIPVTRRRLAPLPAHAPARAEVAA